MAPARRNSSPPEAHQPRVARWRRNAAGGRERQPRRGLGIAQLERIRLGIDAGSSSGLRVANPAPRVPNMIYPNANRCSVCYQKRKSFLDQQNNVHATVAGSNVARNMQQGIIVEYHFLGAYDQRMESAATQSVLVGPSSGGGGGAGGDASGEPVSLDLSLRLSGF